MADSSSNRVIWLLLFAIVAIGGVSFLVFIVTTRSTVLVRTVPAGVEVRINNGLVGTTSDTVFTTLVDPGLTEIVLSREGYQTYTVKRKLARGAVFEIDQIMGRPGMVYVRVGRFLMGVNSGAYNEKPEHPVKLDPYFIDEREVTVRAYKARFPDYISEYVGDDMPATGISWEDANAYCLAGGKRLPTEAEWERACRGAKRSDYAYGHTYDPAKARTGMKVSDGPAETASYSAENAGTHDMTGNVWEWNSDWYDRDYYKVSPEHNPKGPRTGERHVLRGGAWYSNASFSKCTHRPGNIRSQRDPSFGFRCATDLN